jgi:nucleoid DNA-binding protein
MDAPFEGRQTPIAHQRAVESQKVFTSILFEAILKEVSDGNSVKIKNFGAFNQRLTQPTARNPKTGEVVLVKDRKRLQFSPTAKAHDSLNSRES